ncbi:MAG TPA: hypothetical protein ENN80_10925 [Candidatus Hydrogenedentes bacterium]|nr:hypothetical protein [Candidatus Hydrogenedentota bacterium]
MTDVAILHEAEQQLREAVTYYEEKAHGLGLDFETEVERSVQTIAEYPKGWPLRADGTHRCLTHRFPCLVICAYENDRVQIMRSLAARGDQRIGKTECPVQNAQATCK